jgi:hypothetical protein
MEPAGCAAMGRRYAKVWPHYRLLIESYNKAEEVATRHEVLDSMRK